MYPLDREDRPSADWYAERTNFIGLLQLETGPVQSFRAGVAILAPLAGSLLGILLPAK